MANERKRIAECAEVLPGLSVKARLAHDPAGSHQVIMAKHLREGQPYRYADADALRITPARSVVSYQVGPGDVLFVSRGVRNLATLVGDVPATTVATGTFYILRPRDKVDPGYLAWCINQAPVQAAIGQVRTGAGTPIVPRRAFGDILIPLPPLATQRRIAKLAVLMGRERRLLQRLLDETDRRHRLIGQRILDRLTQPEAVDT